MTTIRLLLCVAAVPICITLILAGLVVMNVTSGP